MKTKFCFLAELSSEEESDVPLSEVLKLDKEPDINKNEKAIKNCKIEDPGIVKKESKRGRPQRVRKQIDLSEYSVEWNESDEDVLDLKRIKNEFNYNCYYEPKTMVRFFILFILSVPIYILIYFLLILEINWNCSDQR